MNADNCNRAVYKHGETVGIFAWSKDEAESYRKRASNHEWLYDWYFAAGRVVMKRIRRGLRAAIGRWFISIGREVAKEQKQ